MVEVIVKFVTIVFMFASLFAFGYTAWCFENGYMTLELLGIHKFAGVIFVLNTVVHVYIKRKKLSKIAFQFFRILRGKTLETDRNQIIISKTFEKGSFEDFIKLFSIDKRQAFKALEQINVVSFDTKKPIKDIASEYSVKSISVIARLLQLKKYGL